MRGNMTDDTIEVRVSDAWRVLETDGTTNDDAVRINLAVPTCKYDTYAQSVEVTFARTYTRIDVAGRTYSFDTATGDRIDDDQ